MFGLYSEFAGLDAAPVMTGPGGEAVPPTWDGFKWVQNSPNSPLSAEQIAYNASVGQFVGPSQPIYMGPPAPGQEVVPMPATKAPASGGILDFMTGLFKPITVTSPTAAATTTYRAGTTKAPTSMTKYLPYIAIGGVALVAVLMMTGGSKRK